MKIITKKIMLAMLLSTGLFAQNTRFVGDIVVDSAWTAVLGYSEAFKPSITRYDKFLWEMYGRENLELTTVSEGDTVKYVYVFNKDGEILTATELSSTDTSLYSASYSGGVLKSLVDNDSGGIKIDFDTKGKLTEKYFAYQKNDMQEWETLSTGIVHYDAQNRIDSMYSTVSFMGFMLETAESYHKSSDDNSDTTTMYMSDFTSGKLQFSTKSVFTIVSKNSNMWSINIYDWNDTIKSYEQTGFDNAYFENGKITLDTSFNMDKSVSQVSVFSYDSFGLPRSMEIFDSTGILIGAQYIKSIGVGIITDSKFHNNRGIKLLSTPNKFVLSADRNLSSMQVYSSNGALVADVNAQKNGSSYDYSWNFKDKFGYTVSKGFYICRLDNSSYRIIKR